MTAKSNRAGCRRCARRKFYERGYIFAPIGFSFGCAQPNDLRRISAGESGHYSARSANLQRCVALLLADSLAQRQNKQLLAQTRDENRRPNIMIANLNSYYLPT